MDFLTATGTASWISWNSPAGSRCCAEETAKPFYGIHGRQWHHGPEAFEECFQDLAATREDSISSKEGKARLWSLLDGLYKVLDAVGDGVVDSAKLASSLSVLCGGTSGEKARAVFALDNRDGDGVISLEEMVRYLASVFKIMYHAEPEMAYQMGVSAKDLAAATADQAFEEADLKDDGNQTFEEFQKWYKDPAPTADELAAVEDLVLDWVSLT